MQIPQSFTKFRNQVDGVAKYLATCLFKQQKKLLKMFSKEYYFQGQSARWTKKGKPLREKEKMT